MKELQTLAHFSQKLTQNLSEILNKEVISDFSFHSKLDLSKLPEKELAPFWGELIPLLMLWNKLDANRVSNSKFSTNVIKDFWKHEILLKNINLQKLQKLHNDMINFFDEIKFSDINEQLFDNSQDFLCKIYPEFLRLKDNQNQKSRGIVYTPKSISKTMWKAVNQILKEKFNLKKGILDSSVPIYDPSVGSLAFEINFLKLWGTNSIESNFSKRFFAQELNYSAYWLGWILLQENIDTLNLKNRNIEHRIIEYQNIEQKRENYNVSFSSALSPEFAHNLKKCSEFTESPLLVIGNPPYSVSSANKTPWIIDLMKEYAVPEPNLTRLYDDYVKFIRYGQWLIDQHGQGILAFVTNRKFLDGKIYYGMRRSLMKSFDEIYVIDLFGDQRNVKSEGGSVNLFGIQTGICIGIFIKKLKEKKHTSQELAPIYYRAVKGKTQGKIESQLNLLNASFNPSMFQKITPIEPKNIFIPSPMKPQWAKLWNKSIPLPECFQKTSRAMISSRDRFMIYPDAEVLAENLSLLEKRDFAELRARGKIRKNQTTQDPLLENEAVLKSFDFSAMKKQIFPITYRPFDTQSCIYYTINRRCGKSIILDHLRPDHKALVFVQSMQHPPFNHVFITQGLVDSGLFGYSTAKVAPFQIAGKSNLSEKIQEPIYKFAPDATDEEILGYIYGILQWPLYGTIFEPRLLHEFPRIIIPKSMEIFLKVSKLGMKLINLCTSFKDEIKNQPCIENFALKSWKYDPATEDLILMGMDFSTRKGKEQKIHCIEEIWNYIIGSIRIIEHWLKYRKMTFLNRPWEKKEWSSLDSSIRIIAHFLEIREEISKHLTNFL